MPIELKEIIGCSLGLTGGTHVAMGIVAYKSGLRVRRAHPKVPHPRLVWIL